MRILLDTNTVIWLADDPSVLAAPVLDRLRADDVELLLSSVVPWEVAIKWRSGKLRLAEHPRPWVARLIREFGTRDLPVRTDHVLRVADLPDHHRDPFDRLLIAQAQVEGIPIVTTDAVFARYDIEVIAAR